MRIKSIAISNIRSFKYDPALATEIEFGLKELNLIIGPNGAGKSNLMEIIAKLFSQVFNVDYANNNDDLMRLVQIPAVKMDITASPTTPSSFTKNRDFKDQPSAIKVTVVLDNTDIKNLKRIKANLRVLSQIDDRYYRVISGVNYKEIYNQLNNIPTKPTEYDIELSDIATHTTPSPIFAETSEITIASLYLRAYQMLNNCINMHNDLIRPEQFRNILQNNPSNLSLDLALNQLGINISLAKPIENLLPMLQILSVQERLMDITLDYYPNDNNQGNNSRDAKSRQYEKQSGQRSLLGGVTTAQSISFELIKELCLRQCFTVIETDKTAAEVITIVNRSNPSLKELNTLLKWFGLNIKLTDFVPSRSYVKFKLSEDGHAAEVIDLSSGQKAIMNIASALALTKISDAVVVIDEIENHLHPSVQAKLREMLQAGSGSSSEVIAITHSAVFVNSKTLQRTSRVYHVGGYSTITACGPALVGRQAKTLEAVLNFTNGSRIFFTNKVLLVEGVSDELFFTAFIFKYYAGQDIEVLNVGGDSGLMATWRPFIEVFGVKVFEIHDFDQAVLLTLPAPVPSRSKPKKESYDRSYFLAADLIRIDSNILHERSHGRYVLEQGALESYIDSTIAKKKKIERVLDFLTNDDWTKVNFDVELNDIITDILTR